MVRFNLALSLLIRWGVQRKSQIKTHFIIGESANTFYYTRSRNGNTLLCHVQSFRRSNVFNALHYIAKVKQGLSHSHVYYVSKRPAAMLNGMFVQQYHLIVNFTCL